MNWGYELVKNEFDGELIDGGPWCSFINQKVVKLF